MLVLAVVLSVAVITGVVFIWSLYLDNDRLRGELNWVKHNADDKITELSARHEALLKLVDDHRYAIAKMQEQQHDRPPDRTVARPRTWGATIKAIEEASHAEGQKR